MPTTHHGEADPAWPRMLAVDPDVPQRDQELLTQWARHLEPARVRRGGQWVMCSASFVGTAVASAVALTHLGPHPSSAAVLGVVAACLVGVCLIVTCLYIPLAALAGWGIDDPGLDRTGSRLARQWHGRYVLDTHLDATALASHRRLAEALAAIRGRKVVADDLVDSVELKVALPVNEWEITQSLATHSQRRRAGETPAGSPELAEAVKATEDRIRALERYATLLIKADRAYQQLPPGHADDAAHALDTELIAASVTDAHGAQQINGLAERAAALLAALRDHQADIEGSPKRRRPTGAVRAALSAMLSTRQPANRPRRKQT